MEFHATPIPGAFLIESSPHPDDRGFFMRIFSADEFAEHGLTAAVVQSSLSSNRRRGTVRGMHYQAPPSAETKLIRCIRGAVHSVLVDARPDSPTFRNVMTLVVGADNPTAVLVPKGVVHAYQNIGSGDGIVINCPNRLYMGEQRREPIDEIRHEDDPETIFRMDD